ncbi:MAG: MgtC/SapB family protein [Acidobacteriaceae bacterium]|nr:MgtC/SapB family protein [Acidobacteriaceae bacterium]
MQAETIQIPEAQHILLAGETARRLLLACALGGAIGVERELRRKMSGLRTNLLICMASALFTITSQVLAGTMTSDKSRIASNIVQGVGFLGAGLILHNKTRIHGLTSAATVFVIAAIGIACGTGMYVEACIATVLVLLALQLVGTLEYRIGWQRYTMVYEVRAELGETLPQEAVGAARATALAEASEDAKHRMITAVLRVMDRAGIRFAPDAVENFAGLERLTFPVLATRKVHEKLLADLRASDATDQVLVFRDLEDE